MRTKHHPHPPLLLPHEPEHHGGGGHGAVAVVAVVVVVAVCCGPGTVEVLTPGQPGADCWCKAPCGDCTLLLPPGLHCTATAAAEK